MMCALPPLSPNPRWSKLSTPNPAFRKSANAAGSVVRLPAHPWLWNTSGTGLDGRAPKGLNSV